MPALVSSLLTRVAILSILIFPSQRYSAMFSIKLTVDIAALFSYLLEVLCHYYLQETQAGRDGNEAISGF